jgi:dTDP-4-dehydrorhamnose 3,5-epimerase
MANTPLFIIEELALSGVLKVTPKVFIDERGASSVTYTPEAFEGLGIRSKFVQDYFSRSRKGVIRGMHFQRAPHAQDKLVRCVYGEIFDVAIDHDPASPMYGTSVSAILRADEQSMLFIPGRYAHGFCVLSDEAIVEYKLSDMYHPESAGGVRYDDPVFGIRWPSTEPIVSQQDISWPLLGNKN